MSKLNDFHKSDEINKLLKNQCNEEVINKIRNFYFNEDIVENEITRMEYVCHVSKLGFFTWRFEFECFQSNTL